MATVRGILGQSNPVVTTLTDLYTCPALKNATGRVIVTNRADAATSFRISIAIGGAPDDLFQYVVYDKPIAANDTGSTIAFMVASGGVVRVFATLATLSFVMTGVEEDNL